MQRHTSPLFIVAGGIWLLGAIGAVPGELVQYTPTWHHGHGMMRFLPARERATPPVASSTAESN